MSQELKWVEELFEEGKTDEAKALLLQMLQKDPENKEIHNNLGVILFHEDRIQTARMHVEKALSIDPLFVNAILNFVDILRAQNQHERIIPIIEQYRKSAPENEEIEALYREFTSAGSGAAEEPAERSAPKDPQEAPPEKKVSATVGDGKLKVAMVCIKGLENFLSPIEQHFSDKFDLRLCYSTDNNEFVQAVLWADVVFMEWANELAVNLTNHAEILNGKHVICRLHSYEALAQFPDQMKWERIDQLIFEVDHIHQIVIERIPDLHKRVKKVHILPIGVDLEAFTFKERKPGYNLAFLGGVNYKKGPMLLFHAFRELLKHDERYNLSIAGMVQDPRYPLYFNQLAGELGIGDKIRFEGRVESVQQWFEDKNYIVCSSVLEGQYLAVMEAMASGIKPLVHNFVGARGVYPSDLIWNTLEEFVALAKEEKYDSASYRSYIDKNYNLKVYLEGLEKLFDSIEVS